VTSGRARAFSPPRVDWWRVITDLMRAGLSQRQIAARCDCDHSTINGLRNAVTAHEPRYVLGVQILALWMIEMDKGAADVPMVGTSNAILHQHAAVVTTTIGETAHASCPEDSPHPGCAAA
jgi:hypothetical protein